MRIGILYQNGSDEVVTFVRTRAELVRFLMERGLKWSIEFLHPLDKRTERIQDEIGKCDIYVLAEAIN